ncbi:uncharacterized protein A1O5_13051 [Cladophialophora psammophila CBS 110553]|uniref:JmjC domain-containing protein n=1 Tax=Cladophialophora psammophila CBS 110553 TaxID=1182543 RepID=W9VKY6_9EURO|nr:uncharacterized protein A1O5_13051 [Cladophialophora psammophila CBS 110553]EXJ53695.1 hypothetical protein A1O5_13051 [Cladophialophora psammophila CBS 110553]
MNQFCDSHSDFAALQSGQIQPMPNVLSVADNLNAQDTNRLLDDGDTIHVQPARPKNNTQPSLNSTKNNTPPSSNSTKKKIKPSPNSVKKNTQKKTRPSSNPAKKKTQPFSKLASTTPTYVTQPTLDVSSAINNLNARDINSLLGDGDTIHGQPARPRKITEPSANSPKKNAQPSSNSASVNISSANDNSNTQDTITLPSSDDTDMQATPHEKGTQLPSDSNLTRAMPLSSIELYQTPTTPPTLWLNQMGENLIANAMGLATDPKFGGVITIIGFPPIHHELAAYKSKIAMIPTGHARGVAFDDHKAPGISTLRLWPSSSFRLPDLSPTADQPTLAECETFIDKLTNTPPKRPIQYYVGPSLAADPFFSNLDTLLHPGQQLSQHAPVAGVSTIYWHVGKTGSGTAFHKEDADFRSWNLAIYGWKAWILIKPSETAKFEEFVRSLGPCGDCDQFVRHQNLLIGPQSLKSQGIGFDLLCAGPGQLVVTQKGQYHAVINMTDSFALSVNFLLPNEPLFPENIEFCALCGLHVLYEAKYPNKLIRPLPSGQRTAPATISSSRKRRR